MFSVAAKIHPAYYWWSLEWVSPVTCNLSFNLIAVPMKAGSFLLESSQPYGTDIFLYSLLKTSYIIHLEKQSKWCENSGLQLRSSGFWMNANLIMLGRGYDMLKICKATLQKPSLCFSHSDWAELFRSLSKWEMMPMKFYLCRYLAINIFKWLSLHLCTYIFHICIYNLFIYKILSLGCLTWLPTWLKLFYFCKMLHFI